MGQLSVEMRQEFIEDILEELAYNSTRYVSNECSYDELECKYCGASIRWNSNDTINHNTDCIHIKAWQLLL